MEVFSWNGTDLPKELKKLPAGRYVVVSVDDAPRLTSAEEDGLRSALEQLDQGKGVSHQDVQRRIASALNR